MNQDFLVVNLFFQIGFSGEQLVDFLLKKKCLFAGPLFQVLNFLLKLFIVQVGETEDVDLGLQVLNDFFFQNDSLGRLLKLLFEV